MTRRARRFDAFRPGALWTPAIVGVCLLTWEGFARAGALSALYFPAPSVIGARLIELISSGAMAMHLGATLARLLPGLVLGAVPGLVLGLLMGWSARLRVLVDPLIAAAHPVPKIAVFPLIMVIFGIGDASKIIAIAIAAFFPMLINTMAGVRQISPLYLEAAANYGASLPRTFTRVVLPGSLPMALSGLRIALSIGLTMTIASEIAASEDGLGALIWLSWELLQTETLYASLFVTATLGVGFALLIQLLLRRLVPWQTDHRPALR